MQRVWAHPTNANLAFAAGVNGGVWRTTNAQDAEPVWTALTDAMPSLSVGAMSINPSNSNQLLVGVGRFSSYAGVGTDLIGAYYTEDALSPRPTFRVFGQLNGMSITGAIARTSYLLVTGDQGTFRSLDNGATWEQLDWQGGLGADAVLLAVLVLLEPVAVGGLGVPLPLRDEVAEFVVPEPDEHPVLGLHLGVDGRLGGTGQGRRLTDVQHRAADRDPSGGPGRRDLTLRQQRTVVGQNRASHQAKSASRRRLTAAVAA